MLKNKIYENTHLIKILIN